MLTIETSESWREMGRQLGEQCGDDIRRCMQTYAPWLLEGSRGRARLLRKAMT